MLEASIVDLRTRVIEGPIRAHELFDRATGMGTPARLPGPLAATVPGVDEGNVEPIVAQRNKTGVVQGPHESRVLTFVQIWELTRFPKVLPVAKRAAS